ncbi:MAG: hypothetical protein QM703_04765 [Gemmatales bacterium]
MTTELIIRHPKVERTSGGSLVTVRLDSPDGPFNAFFDVRGGHLEVNASAFATMCLPVAMAKGWSVRSESPVSAKLMGSIPTIQDIFLHFLPGTQRIELDAPSHKDPMAPNREAASFFSGGVDAYYTYLKHRERIRRLIFGMGFDIKLSQTKVIDIVLEQMRRAAQDLGAGLLEVKTNIRDFSDRYVHWRFFIGAALGGTASLLSNLLDAVYIGSSHNYGDMFCWGTHPILDPLWTTEAVEVINDGCEAIRLDKIKLVAQSDEALKSLRVCFNNRDDRYNCSRCEKCLRTMVGLHIHGALERCKTLRNTLDLKRISNLRIGDNDNVKRINLQTYQYIRRERRDPPLERALLLSLRKTSLVKKVKKKIRSYLQPVKKSSVLGLMPGKDV